MHPHASLQLKVAYSHKRPKIQSKSVYLCVWMWIVPYICCHFVYSDGHKSPANTRSTSNEFLRSKEKKPCKIVQVNVLWSFSPKFITNRLQFRIIINLHWNENKNRHGNYKIRILYVSTFFHSLNSTIYSHAFVAADFRFIFCSAICKLCPSALCTLIDHDIKKSDAK